MKIRKEPTDAGIANKMGHPTGSLAADGPSKTHGCRKAKGWHGTAFLLLSCLILGIYVNSLSNNFVNWDDPGLVINNKRIRSLDWQNIKDMFSPRKSVTYQPVRVLSYAIDYQLWKFNPTGYRITNMLFYFFACMMVFFTLQFLSKHFMHGRGEESYRRIALFGSLLFAAHPVHVEAVTWLAARKEVLQGFFFFLGFALYLKGRETEGTKRVLYLGVVLFSILLAVLSKPSAIVFPAVVLVYEIARASDKWKDFVKGHWLFFAIAIGISIVFATILMKVMMEAGGIKPYRGGSFWNNVLVSFYAFVYNVKLVVFTVNYSAAYTLSVSTPLVGLRTFLFMGATLLGAGLSIWSLRKTKVVFFLFFFFLVTLLPYLNLIPISTLLADRYVFIASFSWAFILGILFDRLYGCRRKGFSEGFFKLLSAAVFTMLLAGYSFMTLQQNKVWENSYTLWADAVEKSPESNTANALMGVVYMDIGMDKEAVKFLEKAVELLPYDYQSRNNLGIVYGRMGEPGRALKELATAIWLKPDDDKMKINLAVLYQREKEYHKAENILRKVLETQNGNANLHFRLGLVYKEMGQYDKAVSELTTSMELAPNMINPYEELGNLYATRLNDREKAKFYYAKGIEKTPGAMFKVEQLRWMIHDLESGK
jgi:Flp pilus assembly protein TadD